MRHFFFAMLILLIVGWLLLSRSGPPSDAVLIARWQKNRAAFEELLAMMRKDAGSRGEESREKTALAEKLGILSITGDENFGYELCAYSSGSALSGTEKGFVYREQTPTPLKERLDSIFSRGDGFAYRRIEGNWYLFLDIDR
jgi:hypothetical protein